MELPRRCIERRFGKCCSAASVGHRRRVLAGASVSCNGLYPEGPCRSMAAGIGRIAELAGERPFSQHMTQKKQGGLPVGLLFASFSTNETSTTEPWPAERRLGVS